MLTNFICDVPAVARIVVSCGLLNVCVICRLNWKH